MSTIDKALFTKKFKVVEGKYNDKQVNAIKIEEAPFHGVLYTYGGVKIDEDIQNDCARLSFDYNVLDACGHAINVQAFENYIGELLQELILAQLKHNELVFTGGIDEDRTDDIIELDTQ